MKYLSNIDLVQNQLLNAVIQVLATDPANGKEGQIYYNSANKVLRQYIGTSWVNVGVLYNQESKTGAVITGLNDQGVVKTTNVIGLTLENYTPVEDGYVSADMTLENAFKALDQAVKNAVAGGGEVNQNAWSNISVKKQSTAETAVTGAAADVTITATSKTDTFSVASGNKWVDIGSDDKQINIGHSLSGVTAGAYGAANKVAKVTVDAAGHVTAAEDVEITADAIGADAKGAAANVLGQDGDAATQATVYGVKKAAADAQAAAEAAQTAADGKVASVSATADKGIEIDGPATDPTVGIKLDPADGNAATLSAAGLMVTVPEVNVPVYDIVKDADSGDYAAIYHLTKDGTNTGAAINIPKDLFVKEGKIVDNPTGQPEGKYIELTLQNQTAPIYINVADLVDAYTAGNGIEISASNEVSAKVVAVNGLSVDTNGIKMGLASADAAGAMSSAQFTKLTGIDEGATKDTIALNGTETKTPSFYAPTTGGTAGQVLVAGGDATAPTWQAMPEHYHKYTAANAELTAAGGAYTWIIDAATHGISNSAITVQLFEVTTGEQVMADVSINQANYAVTIKINETVAASPLAANTYKVVLFG